MRITAPGHRTRPAFTMVEMLIVVAIIAALAALTAAGIFFAVGGQQANNTTSQIQPISKALEIHWKAVLDEARKDTPTDAMRLLAGSDPSGDRLKVLWAKTRLVEAFPVSSAEILANPLYNIYLADPGAPTVFYPLIPLPQRKYIRSYQDALRGRNASLTPDGITPFAESSACLLIALSKVKRAGHQLEVDTLGPIVGDLYTHAQGDNVKDIIDGFGKPVGFYRFGWTNTTANNPPAPNLQILNPAGNGSKEFRFADPIDKGGTLLNASWSGSAIIVRVGPTGTPSTTTRGAVFETLFHRIAFAPNVAQYVVPTVVSAGPDKKFGLFLPAQVAARGLARNPSSPDGFDDNVYSYELKD